jgi:hypothetical protein
MTVASWVAMGGPLLIAAVALFDISCIAIGKRTPGQVIQWWARDHPVYAMFFTFFIGAFAAHIFWHA